MTPERKTKVRADTDGRAAHDIGGLDFGPIDRHEHDLALWEKRVDAMMILMYAKKQAFTVDAMRRVIEDYGQHAYDSTDYYEKWVTALRTLLVEQEIATVADIEARMSEIAARHRATGRVVADFDGG